MGSPQYSISVPGTTDVSVVTYESRDVYFCHNCGIKTGTLRNIELFGLNFYLCDDCYKEFKKNQQKHSCPALNPDWYE